MMRPLLIVLLAFTASACQAQLTPALPTAAKVSNPAMVIDDRGSKLELLPSKRAVPSTSGAIDSRALRFAVAHEASPFTTSSLGVVFNHAMQVTGVTTGEITFKMIGNLQATERDFPADDYPRLSKLASPNVFIVTARTPAEYVAVYGRLKSRADIEWVEAIVDYAGTADPQVTR